MPRKPFTVPEANDLLPHVEGVFQELDRLRDEVRGFNEKLQILDALWGPKVLDGANPDHAEFLRHRQSIRDRLSAMERLLREELLERGIRVPAGSLEMGLVDFPTTLDGRWVYLCWRRGEDELLAYHELQTGYQGRQSLTTEVASRMALPGDPARADDSALDF